MEVSIIIVNYNTTEHLKNCLCSLKEFTSGINYEVIIVDNNSSERSIESVCSSYPEFKFILRNNNDGFGAGCNKGAEFATGKYFCFINPDIKINSNVLLELFRFLEQNENISIASPVYIEGDRSLSYTYNYFPNFKWELLESIGKGVNSEINRLIDNEYIKLQKPFEVDWLMGSFLFVRAASYKMVNGFDENFFLYYEDVDIQYRIKKSGSKIICCPQVNVNHYKRSSVRSFNGENIYYFHMSRSHMLFLYNHYSFLKRNIFRVMRMLGLIIRALFLIFRLKFKNKKKQKLIQYIFMLKVYSSSYKKLLSFKYYDLKNVENNSSRKISNDSFWNQ